MPPFHFRNTESRITVLLRLHVNARGEQFAQWLLTGVEHHRFLAHPLELRVIRGCQDRRRGNPCFNRKALDTKLSGSSRQGKDSVSFPRATDATKEGVNVWRFCLCVPPPTHTHLHYLHSTTGANRKRDSFFPTNLLHSAGSLRPVPTFKRCPISFM